MSETAANKNTALSAQPREPLSGFAFALGAYLLWGGLPFYMKAVAHIPAYEVVAHRVIWSVPVAGVILLLLGRTSDLKAAFRSPRTLALAALTAGLISINWGVYVWAVAAGRTVEAALGYYINPLVFVLVGVVVNKEVLRRGQVAAVALAALGVAVLTLYGGVFPWISFVLAGSFTVYGYMRKTVNVGAMPGLFLETLWLVLPALGWLVWLQMQGTSAFVPEQPGMIGMLLLAGPVTVVPLLCFAISARRLRLSTIGFMQFLGPTLQFLVGLYYGEHFSLAHAICFGFIWLAVIVFCIDAWQAGRQPRVVEESL
ncbi:EamA family transporter RarD [uncultured Nitratireductor sp.]|mgnify:CR=1 FL=1|uniref:EamA family transporter RarD n=1 Tax=uncultured Nitratireductor sp. TaxID=520953 RepID=UPI0025F324BC|nr:EamA family transporter RarD [uncultured Nitratireductor sp.]